MRNKIFILFIFLLAESASFAQNNANNLSLYEGNRQYKLKNYTEAQKYYEKAIEGGNSDYKTQFNLGDSYYQQGKFDDAAKKFEEIVETAKTQKDKSKAYHNLGNSWLKKKEYQKSIDAYKNALKNNPADEDTRYNLAYAQKKLQEQNKKNQDKKDQDKKDQDKKDKEDKEKDKDKDKKDDEKKDKDKDKKDGDDEKDKDKKDGDDEKDKGDKQNENKKPQGIDKKQAEQILNAQNNREKELHKMLQAKKMKAGNPTKPEKDW
jgi:tetratricopeptide (TPR) repeat protein